MADRGLLGFFCLSADGAIRVTLTGTMLERAVHVWDGVDVEHVGLSGIGLLVVAKCNRIRFV